MGGGATKIHFWVLGSWTVFQMENLIARSPGTMPETDVKYFLRFLSKCVFNVLVLL